MYSILGYASLAVMVLLILPYILRVLNKSAFGNSKQISEIVKNLKKIHKPLGVTLAIIALIHGYMALGGFRLHTGSLLYLSMLITVCFGILFYIKKKKTFLNIHKSFVVITVLLLATHLLFPSALYYLLN